MLPPYTVLTLGFAPCFLWSSGHRTKHVFLGTATAPGPFAAAVGTASPSASGRNAKPLISLRRGPNRVLEKKERKISTDVQNWVRRRTA